MRSGSPLASQGKDCRFLHNWEVTRLPACVREARRASASSASSSSSSAPSTWVRDITQLADEALRDAADADADADADAAARAKKAELRNKNKFSRQNAAFGAETTGFLSKMTLLVVGLRGTGVEVRRKNNLKRPACSVTLFRSDEADQSVCVCVCVRVCVTVPLHSVATKNHCLRCGGASRR